jgi:DNA-binding XRE family transcriptional regulator
MLLVVSGIPLQNISQCLKIPLLLTKLSKHMKETIHQFLRKRLRKLRAKHSLTQEDVAKIAGINYKYYQSVEAGRRNEVRLSTLEKFANAYNLRIHEFFLLTDPRSSITKSQQAKLKKKGRRKSR